jgi:hypothetical protein
MKIAAHPPLAIARLASTPRIDSATGAFEALLRNDDQARGFGDLGMFGRRLEVVATACADHADVAPKSPPEREPRSRTAPAVHPSASASIGVASTPPRTSTVSASLIAFAQTLVQITVADLSDSPSVTPQAPRTGEPVPHRQAGVVARRVDAGTATAGTDGPPPPAARIRITTGSGLNLAVTDRPDGLAVVIGGLAITSQASARLRLKVVQLAREFGLSLSELSLNGERLDVSPPLVLGGAYGDDAR